MRVESANRSHTTQCPASSAGRMSWRTWSSRAAANRIASACDPNGCAAPLSTTWRMASAPGEPPGSRVSTTPSPKARRRSASIAAWVDLPVPSPPSNVMKRPRVTIGPSMALRMAFGAARSQALGAGAEQSHHQFARRVERALRDGAPGDALRRLERHLQGDVVAAPDLEPPDRRPFLHGRPHRSVVDDAPRELLVLPALDQD